MDVSTIYESLKRIDEQSGLTRGFVILSKHPKHFSDICRIGVDCGLLSNFAKLRKSKKYQEWISKMRSLSDPNEKLRCFLENTLWLDVELPDILTLYVITMSFHLESETETAYQRFEPNLLASGLVDVQDPLLSHNLPNQVLKQLVDTHLQSLIKVRLSEEDFKSFPFLELLRDYQPNDWQNLLALLIHTFETDRVKQSASNMPAAHKELLQQSQKYLFV